MKKIDIKHTFRCLDNDIKKTLLLLYINKLISYSTMNHI